MSSRDVISMLLQDGWIEARQRGAHKQFRHPIKAGLVTVSHPTRDLPIGTLRSIFRQAGIPWKRR